MRRWIKKIFIKVLESEITLCHLIVNYFSYRINRSLASYGKVSTYLMGYINYIHTRQDKEIRRTLRIKAKTWILIQVLSNFFMCHQRRQLNLRAFIFTHIHENEKSSIFLPHSKDWQGGAVVIFISPTKQGRNLPTS